MTPIAARARILNPFEHFPEIALGLVLILSFTGAAAHPWVRDELGLRRW